MIKLFLPVLFPSWRFFSSIGPSPRIEFALLQNENDELVNWQEFRPKPARISFVKGLLLLFHNPRWNETLYINTCAERLFEGYSEMREQEIMRRILASISVGEIIADSNVCYVTYRISAVMREGQVISQPVTFIAKPALLKSAA
ncbi:MAG: hypothetical protein EOO53_10235 [Gammaproteobacteria bacterium]|nr:MAG: hypothetical protein EOO53_10235 [Gammaproteobacteria bacterium]